MPLVEITLRTKGENKTSQVIIEQSSLFEIAAIFEKSDSVVCFIATSMQQTHKPEDFGFVKLEYWSKWKLGLFEDNLTKIVNDPK